MSENENTEQVKEPKMRSQEEIMKKLVEIDNFRSGHVRIIDDNGYYAIRNTILWVLGKRETIA